MDFQEATAAATTCATNHYEWLKDIWLPAAALIWGLLAYWRQNRRRLTVSQIGDMRLAKIVRKDGFNTAYCVEIIIINESPHANIVIDYYDLKLPWNEPELRPLPDPIDASPPSNSYQTPGLITFERDEVLNHRRYQHGKLEPGDAFRGYFLATGSKPVPTDLITKTRGDHIKAEFIVQDTIGKKYKTQIALYF
jgi:hypothetical protein